MSTRKRFQKKSFHKKQNLPQLIRSIVRRQSETKFQTIEQLTYTDVGTAGTIIDLTSIPQGVTANTRIGDRITATKLFVQKIFRLEDSTSSQASLRVMLVQSKGSTLLAANMPGFCEPADLAQMFIIKDIMLTMTSNTLNIAGNMFSGSAPTRIRWKVKKLPKAIIYYDGAISVPKTHGVYLWMIAETVTVQQCGFEQLFYKDL